MALTSGVGCSLSYRGVKQCALAEYPDLLYVAMAISSFVEKKENVEIMTVHVL